MAIKPAIVRMADEYALPLDVAKSTVAAAVGDSLSASSPLQHAAEYEGYDLIIRAFDPSRGWFEINTETLNKRIVRNVTFAVHRALEKAVAFRIQNVANQYLHGVVQGSVSRIEADGTLLIDFSLDNPATGETFLVLGRCPVKDQPPHERDKYKRGDSLKWYLKRSEVVNVRKIPRLEVLLSRTSLEFAACLLRENNYDCGGEMVKVECVRRVSGAFAMFRISGKVERDAILRTGAELKERIRFVPPKTVAAPSISQ